MDRCRPAGTRIVLIEKIETPRSTIDMSCEPDKR